MLTRDLLRMRVHDGVVEPRLLKPTPSLIDLCTSLIGHWRAGIGQRRGDLEDQSVPLLHRSRSLPVARGLQKLLLDASRFADAPSAETLRQEAFALSATALTAPAKDGDTHRQAVAEKLGTDANRLADRLYADLPDQAILEESPGWSPAELIARYNLALCQGLLLRAKELVIIIHDTDLGMRRRLLKALRWRRLLARIHGDDADGLRLEVSGPASILDQSTRYGLQLALFLPALACARHWQAEAHLDLGNEGRGVLRLSDATGLAGDSAFLGYVPDELRDLQATLSPALAGWRFVDPQLIPLRDGEIVVPDLQLEGHGRTIRIELFHRWHARALERRLGQIADRQAANLFLGVDRAVAKAKATAHLVTGPMFAERGFLFRDLPTARVMREVLARCP